MKDEEVLAEFVELADQLVNTKISERYAGALRLIRSASICNAAVRELLKGLKVGIPREVVETLETVDWLLEQTNIDLILLEQDLKIPPPTNPHNLH
jgi:hypothetical protein